MAKTRDGNRPKPVSLPQRMRSSTRAWPRWRASRNWIEPLPGRGVGGEHLVAHAFDGVEQGQLRAGVRAFAADDEPGAGRVAVVGDQAGQFADLGAGAGFAVGVEGGNPVAGRCLAVRMACRTGSVIATPTENRASTPCSRRVRMWASRPWVQPAESDRIRIGVPCR